MNTAFHLRSATKEDDSFLFRLYEDTRHDEISHWGWEKQQQEFFLRMQFEAQKRSYQGMYPQTENSILCDNNMPFGRLLTAKIPKGYLLVDIALLREYRNQGIGSQLIQQLQNKCLDNHHSIFLHVRQENSALRLYRRMGFFEVESDLVYIKMQWVPAGNTSQPIRGDRNAACL